MRLRSIAAEERAARKAWKGVRHRVGWHAFHLDLVSRLHELSPMMRIQEIMVTKPEREQALRLHLYRPIHDPQIRRLARDPDDPRSLNHDPLVIAAHKKECYRNCPWTGRTIFA